MKKIIFLVLLLNFNVYVFAESITSSIADYRDTGYVGLIASYPQFSFFSYHTSEDPEHNCTLYRFDRRLYVGKSSGGGAWDMSTNLRFTNIVIPQGAKVSNAYIYLVGNDARGGVPSEGWSSEVLETDIKGCDEGNSPRINNLDEWYARPQTSASVYWYTPLGPGDAVKSPNIKTVVQEIIDREDWSSGNALQILLLSKDTYRCFICDIDYAAFPVDLYIHIDYDVYIDKGIRLQTPKETIKIAVQNLDGHKLRIRKGDTTYGIPLLATDDDDASAVRIYDGDDVKSLPKID